MRAAPQTSWLGSAATAVALDGAAGAPAKPQWGSRYFITLSAAAADLDPDSDGSADSDADGSSAKAMGLPRRGPRGGGGGGGRKSIPLPFLDSVRMPTWKSAPRMEREAYWRRMKAEIFSLQDDRYLVDHVLLGSSGGGNAGAGELMDAVFKSNFLIHKLNTYPAAVQQLQQYGVPLPVSPNTGQTYQPRPPPVYPAGYTPPRFFISQLDDPPLAQLQQRAHALVSNPLLSLRCELLKVDVATERKQQAAHELEMQQRERDEINRDPKRKREAAKKAAAEAKVAGKSKVAAKLAAKLGAGNEDGASGINAALRTDEEKAEIVAAAAVLANANSELEAQLQANPTVATHMAVESDWLERQLNLIVVRAGYKPIVQAHMARLSSRVRMNERERQAAQAAAAAEEAAAAAASPDAQPISSHPVPGAAFLPPDLSCLSHRPGSFILAQGTLRDVLRVSRRLRRAVMNADCCESLHPQTGHAMVSVVLYEDCEKTYGSNSFLVSVLNWFTQPTLKSFMAYSATPGTWAAEKAAAARLASMAAQSAKNLELDRQLGQERASKLDMLRDLANVQRMRLVADLERQLEEDVARLRAAHLLSVQTELAKLAAEFEGFERSVEDFYAQERRELRVLQLRVEARKSAVLRQELSVCTARRRAVLPDALLPKMLLLSHDLDAPVLFDDVMEMLSTSLAGYAQDPCLSSPLLTPGTHRLAFSMASLADLVRIGRAHGLDSSAIRAKVVEHQASDSIVEPEVLQGTEHNMTEQRGMETHLQLLWRTLHGQQPHMLSSAQEKEQADKAAAASAAAATAAASAVAVSPAPGKKGAHARSVSSKSHPSEAGAGAADEALVAMLLQFLDKHGLSALTSTDTRDNPPLTAQHPATATGSPNPRRGSVWSSASGSSAVAGAPPLSEAALGVLEQQLEHTLDFRLRICTARAHAPAAASTSTAASPAAGAGAGAGAGSGTKDGVEYVRPVLSLLTAMRTRRHASEELKHRHAMIQQVLTQASAAASSEDAKRKARAAAAAGDDPEAAQQDDDEAKRALAAELAHNVERIIAQVTRAHRGAPAMSAVQELQKQLAQAEHAALELGRGVVPPTQAPTQAQAPPASKSPAPSSDMDADARGGRGEIALALFRELVRRVISGLRVNSGWVEQEQDRDRDQLAQASEEAAAATATAGATQLSSNGGGGIAGGGGMPRCLRLSHHSRRINVVRPFRYGTLHSSLSFTRLDDKLPPLDKDKHKWMFEVVVGRLDQGQGTVLVGFDLDASDQDGFADPAHDPPGMAMGPKANLLQGLPRTVQLKSAALVQREHDEALKAFEKVQFDRFARALPLLANMAATQGAASSSDALQRTFGNMLGQANERAHNAQVDVQARMQKVAEKGVPVTAKQTLHAMNAAATAAAQDSLSFVPPAHIPTPPHVTSDAQLAAALLAQNMPFDPLAASTSFYPQTVYHVPSLAAPVKERVQQRASGVMWQSDGIMYAHGQAYQVGVGYGEGDVIGCALDLSTHTAYFLKNGRVFVASPDSARLQMPVALQEQIVREQRQEELEALGRDVQGSIIGGERFVSRTLPSAAAAAEAEEEDELEASDDSATPTRSRPKSTASTQLLRNLHKKTPGQHKKPLTEKQLHAAILASAAAGTNASLLDESPSASAHASPRPATAKLDTMTQLRSPLHSTAADAAAESAGLDPMERIERGNRELQKRLNITAGAAPIELPPPVAMFPSAPVLTHSVSAQPAAGRLSPTKGAGLTTPTTAPKLARSATMARPGAPAVLAPLGASIPRTRSRERNSTLFGGAGGSMSGSASLLQAQQQHVEQQLSMLSNMQVAAAEALANAQEVYNRNQQKAEILEAALRAQTLPQQPIFQQLFAEKQQLLADTHARHSSGTVYADLERAAAMPPVAYTAVPRQSRSRHPRRLHRKSSEQKEGEAELIDYTSDEDAAPTKDGEAGAEAQKAAATVPLLSSALLPSELNLLPTTLLHTRFHDAPLYFQRRFGVRILLPSPKLHLPVLLNTAQLAQALASGVSMLAATDNVSRSLTTVLHTSYHLLSANEALLAAAVERGGPPPEVEAVEEVEAHEIARQNLEAQPLVAPRATASGSNAAADGGAQQQGAAARMRPSMASLARVARAARDKVAQAQPEPFGTNVPRATNNPGEHQQHTDRAAASVAQGRAHYVLRPCIALYSAAPAPPRDTSSYTRGPAPGPRAYVTCNFDGPFRYPLTGFRPAKNVK